ncbi:MAG: M20/M25/M40 family metallo-hydrolase [Gemmatimonadota bacterium]
MASTWPAEVGLLEELVSIRSPSGGEEPIARFIESKARELGLVATRDEASVTLEVTGAVQGPTLAYLSHLDVVPPGEGWTRPAFNATIEGERLYGRGSGDAKASVAAMIMAAADLEKAGGPAHGRLLVILGYSEETRDTTMGVAVSRAGAIDAAVVGEPTNLDIAIAQRGLLMVDLISRGDQRHAAYAADEGGVNALVRLGRDLARLDGIFADRNHPILGPATATPTMVEGGISRNVTPAQAKAVLDVRSTPAWTHQELAARLHEELESEVVVTSDRLVPCESPAESRLLAAAARVRPGAHRFGSATCSDWVFVRHLDAIKCGPGTSRRSHTADEYVDLPELSAARAFYTRLAEAYLQ